MAKENKTTPKDYLIAIGAFILMIGLVGAGIYAVNGGFSTKNKVHKINKIAKGSGQSAQQVLSKFITATGTMGDMSHVTYSDVYDGSATKQIEAIRAQSRERALKYVAEDSLYMQNASDTDVANYALQIHAPEYFKIKDIQLSNLQPINKVHITNINGVTHGYKAVRIIGAFTSDAYQINMTSNDASWDKKYSIDKSEVGYNNIKFVMIKQDGQWKLYNMTGSDKISTRFATYQPDIMKNKPIYYKRAGLLSKGGNLSGTE